MNGQSGLRGSRAWEGAPGSGWQRPKGRLIRRWIGASRRRAERPMPEAPGGGAQIIRLTWKQTFGRPAARGEEAGGPVRGAGPAVTLALTPWRHPCAATDLSRDVEKA